MKYLSALIHNSINLFSGNELACEVAEEPLPLARSGIEGSSSVAGKFGNEA